MRHLEGAGPVHIAALATAEVRQAGRAERDELTHRVEIGVDEVAGVLVGGVRRGVRVHVHDGDDAVIRLVLANRQLDEAGRAVGVVLAEGAGGGVRTGEVSHHPAQRGVSQQREAVGRTVLAVDGGDEVVQHRLAEGARGVDGASRGAVVRGDIRRTSRVDPVAQTAHRVGRAATVLSRTILRAEEDGFDVTLQLLDGLHLRTGDVLRANRGDGLLEIGHAEGPAPLVDVVAKAGHGLKLVVEVGDISAFAHRRGDGSGQLVHAPLNEGGVALELVSGAEERRFAGSQRADGIVEVLTVEGRAAGRGGIVGVGERHN